ncbi:Glutaredoxin [Corchorus olitorius]|uniref:Glutaredoxin n=1 Tax=Corchorus olitorius TaxID=93759 RepID=A0A1R3KRS0_9ROSI|nr:Glutaredoxin [Corchorus olitorius]
MGCASSKQRRCRHCQAPFSPVPRSYSMHVHHPAQHKGDSYHVVALTSTTLGTLKLEDSNPQTNGNSINVAAFNGNLENGTKINGNVKEVEVVESKGLAMEVIEAKVWSKMIQEKIPKVIPKTPVRTPPGEPETINTWEMMAGLEDISPLRSPGHFRSFSFDVVRNSAPKENGKVSPKPMWLQLEDDEDQSLNPVITDFDPEVLSSFRKSLQLLPPDNPFHIRPLENENEQDYEKKSDEIVVASDFKFVASDFKLKKDKVIVYFTSLRGVRKTYEDCCHVRVILKSLGVRIDERDVSMHSGFKEELKELMGEGFKGGLPRVFIGKKYIGGAEEIRRMHEEGQLEKAVEGCEMVEDDGGGNGGGVCEACGDVREEFPGYNFEYKEQNKIKCVCHKAGF